MKKKQMQAAIEALSPIKPNRITDKDIRKAVRSNFLTLLDEQRKFELAVKDLEKVHLGASKDEQEEVHLLKMRLQRETDREKRQALQREIDSHATLFEDVREFNKAVIAIGEETVPLQMIDREKFLSEIDSMDYDLGMIKALSPMFNA